MNAYLRWTVMLAVGAAAAVATGLVAAHFRPDDDRLETVVYALMVLPAYLGLVYVVLIPRDQLPEHPEDNVEAAWIDRATSRAFLDLVTVLGLGTAAQAVLDLGAVPLVLLLVLALVDAGVRYGVIRRQEA